MEHAREIELIELVAQRLDLERRKAILAHLPECPACRTKLEAITKTWNLLGAWQVQPAGHAVLARTVPTSSRAKGAGLIVRFPGFGMVVRVAAAIAVAGLAGYTSGRWSVHRAPTGPAVELPQYVSVLGLELADSFSPLVLQDGPSSGQEG